MWCVLFLDKDHVEVNRNWLLLHDVVFWIFEKKLLFYIFMQIFFLSLRNLVWRSSVKKGAALESLTCSCYCWWRSLGTSFLSPKKGEKRARMFWKKLFFSLLNFLNTFFLLTTSFFTLSGHVYLTRDWSRVSFSLGHHSKHPRWSVSFFFFFHQFSSPAGCHDPATGVWPGSDLFVCGSQMSKGGGQR